jgi:NADH:ubiquinone oxidoreductase subunit F (NADH-binding)
MDCDTEEKYCGLKECLMPSGKVLWLCEGHRNQPRVKIITSSVSGNYSRPQVEDNNEMIKALAIINERSK